jgi:hypothetical protein
MTRGQIEARLSALEEEIARLKRLAKPWWEQMWGTFANDPAFDEAMRLGRRYREGQRPGARGRRKRQNGRARH